VELGAGCENQMARILNRLGWLHAQYYGLLGCDAVVGYMFQRKMLPAQC
jgi:hypothetical protein